ncbi:Eco57I restriction-modification methylase domain-containing protein [Natrinema ejinorense]|uniref:site-specific DNA-methyltransferase (adenine-specific) n=1 Tax=Natrinema ejinorense TaxID=373386 RepID=A0A2A5QZW8_9EURY|nr:TaqI-like C-terminal specificity domain-containing protein [Natrinema ejinorense]PCR92309.1 restriction endonuclease [Natrinema ejinorense]
MQRSPTYRTNRGLFSTRYLEERLPETNAWDAVDEGELRAAYDDLRTRLAETEGASARSDAARTERFVRSVFRTLEIPFAVDEGSDRTDPRPDYGFFRSASAARAASGRRQSGGELYADAVAVAHSTRWGRPLGGHASGEWTRAFDPSHRLSASFRETATEWALLTNGKRWRLYHASTGSRLDAYYEIDLPTLLETGDLEAFRYFYCFFRHEAFLEAPDGESFLDAAVRESDAFARELVAALEENAAEALAVLAEGFRRHPDNDLGESDLESLFEGALVYLYRLLIVQYAEATGHEPFEATDASGERSGRHSALEQVIATDRDDGTSTDGDCQRALQSRLDDLFRTIGSGARSREGSETALSPPAYPGWLFRTAPSADDRQELRFLATHSIGDAALERVVELLTRRPAPAGEGTTTIDYASLDGRHLGSLYERLLEYELALAGESLTLEAAEYGATGVAASVEAGEVYVTTGSGDRKATGSYYTPEHVVSYVVERTLEPLVDDVREETRARDAPGEPGFAAAFTDRLLEVTVLDPTMGTGHFLTHAVEFLARELVAAHATRADREAVADERDVHWARRAVASRCVYGVDCDPLAVELARTSLWLRTRGAGGSLESLQRHLQTGNALVGTSPDREIPRPDRERPDGCDSTAMAGDSPAGDAWNRRRDRLEATANVRTAREFGLDGVPDDAVERVASAVDDDEAWTRLAGTGWFQTAQSWADIERCFHWPLAFPEVCDDGGGAEIGGSGFDAIVGNPPWVATAGRSDTSASMGTELRSYLASTFEATENQFDLAVAFYEQAIRQSHDGRVGIVVPDSILTREGNEPIREFVLENASLSRIVRIGTAFPDAETGAVVCISGDDDGGVRCADASDRTMLASLSYTVIPERVFEQRGSTRFLLSLDEEARSILETVDRRPPLAAFATVSRGEESSKRAPHLSSSQQRSGDSRPIAPGSAVCRYGIDADDLRYIRAADVAKDEGQYRGPKLVFRQTSDSLVGTYDATDLVTIKSAYTIHTGSGSSDELKHVLGVLNSPLLNFYHHYTHAAYRSVFPQINQSTFEAFPIAIEEGPDPALVEAVDDRLERTAERSAISRNVLDYLGQYEDGASLGSLSGCRPVAGVGATKLAATTTEWADLRLGTIDVTAEGRSIALSASVRYKPDERGLDTDQWGYTETEPIPALELGGNDAERRLLVESFLPAAVDRARGFAGFRKPATKTISPLERLEAVRLPRLEDVVDGLRAFGGRRARARRLDERIAELDRRIADRVFDLYGIAPESRERIRREFGGR